MSILPDYQKKIQSPLNEVRAIVQKYAQQDSPLAPGKAKQFMAVMEEVSKHCAHILESGQPKIMLYGTYNAGKSTLLNALMGEEKAPMGDVPTTYEKGSYFWKGYELVDTPGINAPIEHERVSRESLKESQVILFVISSGGSHDDANIYAAMKEVVDMGKKLFIVLNDKEGYGINSPEIRNIADSIQKNLEKAGLARHVAASFNFCVVNAQFTLDGRIGNDENLIKFSGIAELEQRMLQEIQRVRGFEIMADLCSYIIDSLKPFADALTQLGSVAGNEKMNNYYELLEDNGKFYTLLESKVDDKCAALPASIRNCFGRPVGQKTQEEVNNAINNVYENYDRDLGDVWKINCEIYLAGIAKRINKIIDINVSSAPHTRGTVDEGRYADMNQRHQDALDESKIVRQGEITGESGTDIWDILIAGLPVLDKIPLPKLPVPIPGPMGPYTVPMIMTVVKKVYDLIFGESEEDKRNRLLEEEIRAEREAAERRAREMARYEEELKQYCQDMAMEFRREAKSKFCQSLFGLMEPLFQQIREEFKIQSQIGERVFSDVNKMGELMSSFEMIRTDLKTPVI